MANFDSEIKQINIRQDELARDINSLQEKLKEASKFTQKFLSECAKSGISDVSISRKHQSVKPSMDWPFGSSGSVFGLGKNDENGWPAIWGVVERLGISHGCGNTGQHNAKTENLIDGVYHLRGGKWTRVDSNQ